MSLSAPVTPLDANLVDFLTSGGSLLLAASAQGRSTLVRAMGCRVDREQDTVTVYVKRSQAEPLLRTVDASGRVAMVVSLPNNHRTVQLKGVDARVTAVQPGDAADIERQLVGFASRVARYGVTEQFVRALYSVDIDDLAAISFTPGRAFSQTPGESAGSEIPVGALPK